MKLFVPAIALFYSSEAEVSQPVAVPVPASEPASEPAWKLEPTTTEKYNALLALNQAFYLTIMGYDIGATNIPDSELFKNEEQLIF